MASTINANNTTGLVTTADTSGILQLQTNGTTAVTVDASQNVGVGVTPSAWASSHKIAQIGNNSSFGNSTSGTYIGNNWFYDGANKYLTGTNFGALYGQNAGQHQWYNAPSGTAGSAMTLTQAMTLDASGNLLLGSTSSPSTIWSGSRTFAYVKGNTAGNGGEVIVESNNGNQQASFFASAITAEFGLWSTKANAILFGTNNAERARITSSGDLLVGTTSQITNEKLSVNTGNTVGVGVKTTGGASNAPIFSWNATTSGDGFFVAFATETSLTVRGSITYNRSAGLTSYNTTSDYRAKDITGPVTGSGALIDSVPVYMGKMKGATQERPMFIAHEVPAYAHTGEKDAVDENGNPKYQQMDASALIPVMWAEIQSLRQRLSTLETRLDAANL